MDESYKEDQIANTESSHSKSKFSIHVSRLSALKTCGISQKMPPVSQTILSGLQACQQHSTRIDFLCANEGTLKPTMSERSGLDSIFQTPDVIEFKETSSPSKLITSSEMIDSHERHVRQGLDNG